MTMQFIYHHLGALEWLNQPMTDILESGFIFN